MVVFTGPEHWNRNIYRVQKQKVMVIIGWLTSWREVKSLYIVAFIVIVANKAIDIAVSKIRSRIKDR